MKYGNKATDVLTVRPNCDICKQPAEVDGKTRRGPWGYMCGKCFAEKGSGLGMNRGQILLCGDRHDAELIRKYELE